MNIGNKVKVNIPNSPKYGKHRGMKNVEGIVTDNFRKTDEVTVIFKDGWLRIYRPRKQK